MKSRTKAALIYGSTREGRFCDIVAEWSIARIKERDEFDLVVIDPGKLSLSFRHEKVPTPELLGLHEQMSAAECYIIVTPEYNHGYPAALKFVIDAMTPHWRAKPVGFVSYGGISGGLRSVEQLRAVLAEVHAVTVRDSVCFTNAWEQFSPTGELMKPGAATRAMTTLLTQLNWWAVALRNARNVSPYEQIQAVV